MRFLSAEYIFTHFEALEDLLHIRRERIEVAIFFGSARIVLLERIRACEMD